MDGWLDGRTENARLENAAPNCTTGKRGERHVWKPNCVLHVVFSLVFIVSLIFRSSPTDDLVDWNSGVSVRTSTKSFSDFHLIWYVGRPRLHMRTSVTSTRSKVKVTELPKLRKVHFSRSISSATFTWTSKLMIDSDTGTWSTACRSPIYEFPSRKAITRVQTSPNVDISRNSNGHMSVLRNATVTWLGVQVAIHIGLLRMLIWPWPDPRSRSRSRGFWTSDN